MSSSQGAESSYGDAGSIFPSPVVSSGPAPKDYWFGQKYFESILAEDLLRGTASQESVSGIDV
jgi:hypothetical protein